MTAIAQVHAAGGVVVRRVANDPDPSGLEVVLIHRPRYGDWSFPKGKLKPGEGWEAGALREVEEETGLRCAIDRELPSVRYLDRRGRRKLVRYWLMRPLAGDDVSRYESNDEVDAVRWVPVAAAPAELSYEHDRELVAVLAR